MSESNICVLLSFALEHPASRRTSAQSVSHFDQQRRDELNSFRNCVLIGSPLSVAPAQKVPEIASRRGS